MIRVRYFLMIFNLVFIPPLYADGTHPQGVNLDGTIGNAGKLDLSGPDYAVKPEYGRQAGSNLFHSFQQFNIHNGESAIFSGPDSVKNIISRVTGGAASWIDGKLASTIPGADLYFLNPAGVVFGGNASLDLKGSFHVSTADYLRLGDNERFYSKPMTGEILSVAAPTAFGFLSNAPAKISIQGKGYVSPESYEDEIFKGLRVFGDNSFSIIGGDIEFINGKYTTINDENMPLGALAIPEKGRINLASAASAGEVILKPDGIDITSEKLGTIRVAEESALHVGGQIYIRSGSFVADKGYINAGEINLPNGKIIGGNNGLVDINVNTLLFSNDSDILIQTLGSGDAGNVNIQARKAVFGEYSSVTSATYASGNAGNISISAEELSFDTNSGITSATAGSGNAGSVKITADRLAFTNQSGINSSSLAQGNGGDVVIRAEESVSLSSSGIYSGTFSQENNAGPAGKVHIITPELCLSDASKIWASTAGQGNAGWINFEISELEMSGKSSVASDSLSESTGGKGGGILIGQTMEQTDNTHTISQPAQNIRMQDQSYIGTSARGEGNAGGVAIAVSQLEMDSGSIISSSSRQGEGGGVVLGKHIEVSIIDKSYLQEMDDTTIQVDQPADTIRIRNQSGISVSVEGEKNAGGIAIAAKELDMDQDAFITSSGKSSGSGGLILIGGSVSELENNGIQLLSPSDEIRIRNHSVVSTSASGQGNAGAIFMRSSNVSLDSGAAVASASLSETDGGNAGVIEIHADNISLENSAKISTSSNGQGDGGTIILETFRLDMDTDASIFSTSRSENNGGDGGEIFIAGNIVGDDSSVTLQASDSIRLQNNASVSTSSNGQGKAGNIIISCSELDMNSSASISSGSLSHENGGDGGGIAVGKEIVMKTSDTETTLISITKPSDTIRIRNHANINTSANGRGNAGRIGLGVSELELDSGAFISSVSNAQGESGNGGIIIVAGAIEEVGKDLYAASESSSKIHLRNNAEISTSSAGTGNAGAILLFASETAMDSNASVSSASLFEQNGGNGGIIQILSEYLKLGNHAGITTSSSGQGDAGAIFLLASRVEMDTQASISSRSQSRTDGGNGGGIFMMKNRMTDESGSTFTLQPSDSIRLRNNASVSTSSSGQGDAGNILLTTSELDMDSSASISSGSLSEGHGGEGGAIGIGKEIVMKNTDTEDERFSVTQPSDTIRLRNHANINSSSKGYGDAGEIGLGVSDLELDSSALISSVGKNGQGGMIIIAGTIDEPENEQFTTPEFADHIRLHGNSAITTSSEGYGDAGDIRLKTRHLEMHDASVSSDADFSGGGRITVDVEDTVYLINSRITTNVYQGIGNGGDIGLSATCNMQSAKCGAGVVILNHSEIQANADEGDGGAVFIVTDNFLKSFGSIVEATSERGNEGTVEIEAPDLDISGKLIVMPGTFFDAEKWVYDSCEFRSGKERGRFTIRRYVAPPDPLGDNGF